MHTGKSCRKFIQRSLLSFFFAGPMAYAKAPTVFEVKEPLAMNPQQKTYRDYYINGGSDVGLKVGHVVTITRRHSLHDKFKNQSAGDLVVPVGRLKIIHSQQGMSVGRMYSVYTRENIPTLDYDYIMIGDKVDLSTATMALPKKRRKNSRSGSNNKDNGNGVKKAKVEDVKPPTYRPAVKPAEAKPVEMKKDMAKVNKKEMASKSYAPNPVEGPALQ